MNRRELIKKGFGLGLAATGILGIISSKSQANQALVLLDDLIDKVAALNSKEGIINSLDAKLNAALQAINDIKENNNVAAINSMEAFINAVEAQRGQHISDDDANALIAAASNIIIELTNNGGGGCGGSGCDDPDCQCGGPPCIPPCGGAGGGTGV